MLKGEFLIRLLVVSVLFCASRVTLATDLTINAWVQDSKPKYLLDAGQLTGLCGDVYNALAVQLKKRGVLLQVDLVELPIRRILKQIDSSANGLFCGAGRNAQREKQFKFAKVPIYTVSNVVAAHADEDYVPKDFAQLAKDQIPVGALFGTSSAAFLKKQPGVSVVDQIYSLDEALKLVGLKRVRLFYYHDLGLNYLTNHSEYALKVLPTKFRSTPQWLLYSKGMPAELSEPLEEALLGMSKSGELQKIVNKYL